MGGEGREEGEGGGGGGDGSGGGDGKRWEGRGVLPYVAVAGYFISYCYWISKRSFASITGRA